MTKLIGIIAAGIVLMGCTSKPTSPLILKTQMQSPVSGPTTNTVEANNYLKKTNTQHVILYPLPPLPDHEFRDDLDRKFAAAKVFITYIPTSSKQSVEISGNVNYYERQQYYNAQLIGDVARSFPIPVTKLELTKGKPTTVKLPRGIKYTIELADRPY